MPPAVVWPVWLGVITRLRVVLTVIASCRRSDAPVAADSARKYTWLVPATKLAGTAMLAKIGFEAPDSSTPVLVMIALFESRKVTDQPAGRPAEIAESVAA